VQATGAGLGIALSGVLRDVLNAVAPEQGLWGLAPAASGYLGVYALEIVLLLVTLVAITPLLRRRELADVGRAPAPQA
jgi:BCD family chlorophyll transporter-like MFS transporter